MQLAGGETGRFKNRVFVHRGISIFEPETGMNDSSSVVDAILVDNHRDFNLGGRDHLDIDFCFAEKVEHPRCDSGMRSHPDADHAEFGDTSLSCNPSGAYFRDDRAEMFFYLW